MLWYKGWLETRYRLLLLLVLMSGFLIFFMSVSGHEPVKPLIGFLSDMVPSFVVITCGVRGGARNRHATLFTGGERSPRLHDVYSVPACEPVPVARGQSQPRMVGDGGHDWSVVLRNLVCIPGPQGYGDGARTVPVRGNAHGLCVSSLFPICLCRYFPRRSMAFVGHNDRRRGVIVGFESRSTAHIHRRISSHGKGLAADHAYDAMGSRGLLTRADRHSVVRGAESRTESRILIREHMKQQLRKLTICLALTAIGAFAQTKPSFEVATIKPAPPLDPAKMMAIMQSGGKMPVGANIDAHRAEYLYLDLKTLLAFAYGVKPYQITGPDWISKTRFDIVAKMPDGSTKEDAPKMLQSLLEERFKLASHRTSEEHPVLALVVGKGGLKLKPSAEKPVAIDESAPLKPGEMKMDGPEGPVRVKIDMATGSSVVDTGLKGKMSYKMDPATRTIHVEFSMTTMTGLAEMMTQLMSQLAGGTAGRQIVDQTGIQGNYDGSLELSMTEMMAMARSAGMDIPGAGPSGVEGAVPVASDPGGGSSVTQAVQSMGLKLESRKAVVDQFIVDHVEKTPTEN